MTKQEEYERILKYIMDRVLLNTREEEVSVEKLVRISEEASYTQYIQDTKKVKKSKPVVSKGVEEAFLTFWSAYPSTSKFTYKGKTFQGERSLKSNKSMCMKLYNEIVTSTTVGVSVNIDTCAKTLLKALQVQLEHIKIESYKKGDNRMQYMSSMEPYLRQRKYESWLNEEMPEEVETKKVYSNSTDL